MENKSRRPVRERMVVYPTHRKCDGLSFSATSFAIEENNDSPEWQLSKAVFEIRVVLFFQNGVEFEVSFAIF